ncbi:DUF4446 family protein [Heliorestis acidaminivorans]|uniref:DUF4446 family protein n=1 Tax=Heliorestis acidaminivorans TaxID=553427 RepID=A0A6I0F1U7_9FIRM|nr:DUF4446 family protein [Heliorestis acidaminivorans]KAB2953911.1 DUF4446 family protein [Heliorestis acidaminivorans]
MPLGMEGIHENIVTLLLASWGLTILALVLLAVLFYQFSKIKKMYRTLMTGQEGNQKNLEELLLENLNLNQELSAQLKEHEQELIKLKKISLETIRHVGIIRFNAFENIGSNQSFSVALLDHRGCGVVLSSLYGRELSQVYAKPVKEGNSTYPLTDEEKKAIQQAMIG